MAMERRFEQVILHFELFLLNYELQHVVGQGLVERRAEGTGAAFAHHVTAQAIPADGAVLPHRVTAFGAPVFIQ